MKKAYFYAGVAILFWSSLATVSKLLLGTMNSFRVLLCSAFFAFLALFFVNLFTGRLKLLRNYTPKDYAKILLMGSLGTFFYYVFFYAGTARMEASQAFIINYLWPIMSVLFGCILLKERLTIRKCAAFLLSFLGVLTVAGGDLLHFNVEMLGGAGFCILAALSYGAFCALGCKWKYDDLLSMMISFFASFLLSLVINLFMEGEWKIGVFEVLGFAWNGIFVMAIATVAWAMALKRGGNAKISNLAYITPFLSLVWTFFILHEKIRLLSLLGLALIILGIFIQLKDRKRPESAAFDGTAIAKQSKKKERVSS